MAGLMDFLQSASNSAASNVSAPVDGLAWLLRKAGVQVPQNPLLGSDWMAEKGLTKPVAQSGASLMGETAGMLAPFLAAAKAPQIAKGLLQSADNLAAPRTMNPQTGAVVWHGSPHKFDAFDASKIGTGEGAQAYGHGLYLADNPSVARGYQEKLSSAGGARTQIAQQGSTDAALVEAERRIGNYKKMIADGGGGDLSRAQSMLSIAEKNAADLRTMQAGLPDNTGALYKVDLPDEHIAKMLDWDKPLSGQSAEVQQLLSGVDNTNASMNYGDMMTSLNAAPHLRNVKDYPFMHPKGSDIYNSLGDAMMVGNSAKGQVNASDKLKALGIPGIRYLDGGSRATGGTSNYVVFPGNEGLLSILERNGQPIK